jgi:hypothetical protein
MKLTTKLSILGMMACSGAMAADFSASITPQGINLYETPAQGMVLVQGSPYVLPQPGVAYPLTPQLIAMSPGHDFLYVVYEQVPFHGDLPKDVNVVAFQVTDSGLVNQWSFALNMDPAEYKYISLVAGLNSVIVVTRPNGLFANVFNEAGQQIYGDVSHGGDQLLSGHVAPDNRFYYSCRQNASGAYVSVYDLGTVQSPGTSLLLTSYDADFIRSVCN